MNSQVYKIINTITNVFKLNFYYLRLNLIIALLIVLAVYLGIHFINFSNIKESFVRSGLDEKHDRKSLRLLSSAQLKQIILEGGKTEVRSQKIISKSKNEWINTLYYLYRTNAKNNEFEKNIIIDKAIERERNNNKNKNTDCSKLLAQQSKHFTEELNNLFIQNKSKVDETLEQQKKNETELINYYTNIINAKKDEIIDLQSQISKLETTLINKKIMIEDIKTQIQNKVQKNNDLKKQINLSKSNSYQV